VFSQMPSNFKCKVNKAIFEFIFKTIKDNHEKTMDVFRMWAN